MGKRKGRRKRKQHQHSARLATEEYEYHQGYNWQVITKKGQQPDVLDLMINPRRRIKR